MIDILTKSEILADLSISGWQATEKPEIWADLSISGWQTTEKSIIKKENEHLLRQCRFSFFSLEEYEIQQRNQTKRILKYCNKRI